MHAGVVDIVFLCFVYLVCGFLATISPWILPLLDRIKKSDEEQAALWMLSILFWPLWFLTLPYHAARGLIYLGRGLIFVGRGFTFVGRGFVSLYRSIRPRKVELPRAIAREGCVSVVVSNVVAEGDIVVVAENGAYEGRKSC